ncbi:MAG TPA: TIM barrel protein [Isosphaeraceae bacterium]|jgi:hexulose-6-phosphate isomerase|nr:TIM barrel protein [Isosphaeraceae bacterium]
MPTIDRRSFLKTSAAALAVATPGASVMADEPAADRRWKKAFMLGGELKSGSVADEFQLLKDAGFEGVEILSPNNLDRDEILRARDKAGIVIHGVCCSRHWKDTLSDPDPAVTERGLAAMRVALVDCRAYGGTTVLLVPAVVTKQVSYREAYERSQANIRKLLPDAEKNGVKIAIEEVWNRFLLSPPEFVRYIDEFQSPWVGAYFDVGNVVEYGYPEEWIRELGKRILKVHIKEYGKPKRFSYELGEGEIDWQAVRTALADVGYNGWITAEVPKGNLEAMKDVVARMNKLFGLG